MIVPVYGTEKYLKRCLDSLAGQSYQELEIIVVSDGSPGNVAEIMAEYREDPRIRFIDNKDNRGLLRARVCGSQQASGEYIAFVDSDDYVSFDFYRTLITKAQETDADITIGKTVWENGAERYIHNYHEAALSFDLIKGDRIREVFFGQEYQCYSWHTIWNKLYRKALWDRCAEEFEAVQNHIIMTEDIFFSSLLFFNADVVSRVNQDAYFYCVNETASTNSSGITIERYLKNIKDITFVFSAVEKYLVKHRASESIMEGFRKGRGHYARMWKNLASNTFKGEQKQLALEGVSRLDSSEEEADEQEYFFESMRTPWGGGLEYIKEQIGGCEEEYISFDIFDTLITRPFYEPKDLFLLLDAPFSELMQNSISFSKIRIEAEELARAYYGQKMSVEDITVDEIYEYIIGHYGIPRDVAVKMKELEHENELNFCTARESGKSLLQLAHQSGKQVILISDMYLSSRFIEKMLLKCGITEYDRIFVSCEERSLKYSGNLFRHVLKELKTEPGNMLHLGDSWRSDIEGSRLAGIRSIFLPKAVEVFENKISECTTNRCAEIGRSTCGDHIDYKKSSENLGIRCMKAMAANFYFDNPYRAFHSSSDFNADPYFIGYYLLGMHVLGLSKWIDETMKNAGYKNLVFLARDGYLPMKAHASYSGGKELPYGISYVQASRKALMPVMVRDVLNLYQLPIEFRAHTPETLASMLEFLGETSDTFWNELKRSGLRPNQPFADVEEYHRFVRIFIRHCYDSDRHEKSKSLVREYYRNLPENCIAFDMGYSGRIQAAICEAAEKKIDVLFLHEDYVSSVRTKQSAGFSISDFYPYYPSVSGLMREHIFSDYKGSCVGFRETDGAVVPVYEEERHDFADKAVIQMLQGGATDFVERFTECFSKYEAVNGFSPFMASVPFEGFLRKPSRVDLHIFSASCFEDMVFGASERINIEQFALNQLAVMESEKSESEFRESIYEENPRIMDMINHSSQIKRAFVWLLLDRKFLMEKIRINFNRWFRRK